MKKNEILLIPNDDYDLIEYYGEDITFFEPPKNLKDVYVIINDILKSNIETKSEDKISKIQINSIKEKCFEKIEEYTISYNLKILSEKYDASELINLFKPELNVEQVVNIIYILKFGKIIIDNQKIRVCNEDDDSSVNIEIAKKVYNDNKNVSINNKEYKTLYEMERYILRVLSNNTHFLSLMSNHSKEARKIIEMIIEGEIFNENLTYQDIHGMLKIIDSFSNKYPENSGESVKYFIENGTKMLPIYKETYDYIDYYSNEYAKLDYFVVLKITKHCEKLGITDSKLIKERLSFTQLKKLEVALNSRKKNT